MEKVESLIKLAELAASRHDQRRQYEWKVSFAFWALLVTGMIKGHTMLIGKPWWLYAIVLLLYCFLWLRGVWVANANDKALYDHYWKQAVDILQDEGHRIGQPPEKIIRKSWSYWIGHLGNWAMLFHLAVTVLLLIVLYFTVNIEMPDNVPNNFIIIIKDKMNVPH